jgi:predicted aspartyl protease
MLSASRQYSSQRDTNLITRQRRISICFDFLGSYIIPNMRTALLACFGLIALMVVTGQTAPSDKIKLLYDARNWPELQNALSESQGSPLYRAAFAIALNQDSEVSESRLREVIKASPHSEDAYEAYERLMHLYLRTGQYHRLIAVLDERWAAFPGKTNDRKQEEAYLNPFRGMPDQELSHFQPSTVSHAPGKIAIPVSINGSSATYFFDTGAWFSIMSESDAKRFGLRISRLPGTVGTMTSSSAFHTAVADDVRIGGMRFRNVTFGVFRDDQGPFSTLPPGHRGALGFPLVFAFRTLRWVQNGSMQIGQPSEPFDLAKSNLYFDDDHLVVTATTESQKVVATLDTGALTTDLFSGFAKQFAAVLEKSGKKDSRDVQTLGGVKKFESVTVPELTFRIGSVDTFLRPAQVITNEAGNKCCVGNFGMDLLKQGRAFKIDFTAMRLDLEAN